MTNPLIKTLQEGEKEFIELLESLREEVKKETEDDKYESQDESDAYKSAMVKISSLLDEAINLYKK